MAGPGISKSMRMKKRPVCRVAELLALEDVAVPLRQEPGDVVDDARPVRAGEDEHEVARRLDHGPLPTLRLQKRILRYATDFR